MDTKNIILKVNSEMYDKYKGFCKMRTIPKTKIEKDYGN